MLCLVVTKKFFVFETSNEKNIRKLTNNVRNLYFNYNLNTNRRLKCHIGRDNQNSILAIKKNRYLCEIEKRCNYSRFNMHEYETMFQSIVYVKVHKNYIRLIK